MKKAGNLTPALFGLKEVFMWIKSLNRDTWVNMKHVTHFSVQTGESLKKDTGDVKVVVTYFAYAYLNTSSLRSNRSLNDLLRNPLQENTTVEDQARIPVCRGSRTECREFIEKQQFLEGLFQWVGYLVAGGVGAVLTYLFTKYGLPLP